MRTRRARPYRQGRASGTTLRLNEARPSSVASAATLPILGKMRLYVYVQEGPVPPSGAHPSRAATWRTCAAGRGTSYSAIRRPLAEVSKTVVTLWGAYLVGADLDGASFGDGDLSATLFEYKQLANPIIADDAKMPRRTKAGIPLGTTYGDWRRAKERGKEDEDAGDLRNGS